MTVSPVLWTLVVLVVAATLAASVRGVLAARSVGAPIRAGALLPVSETARLLRQERRTLLAADTPLWRVAGAGLALVPLLMVSVVPLGPDAVLDSPVGIVWFNATDVMVWALVWLLGWGANSAYALVGAFRFLASALAYELPLMFALTAPAVAAGSLRVSDVVAGQQGLWYVVWMPVAFAVTLIGVVGSSVWGPLSPAAAPDLAGGVLAELSGPDRLLASAGRYLLLVAGSAFTATLFLGGSQGPLLPGWLWMSLKTLVVVVALVAVRDRVALLRPDRFLEVGWLVLLPATLVQLLVVSLVVAS
ncbi:complex I subunit 1 family protein [Lapillicoccus sp.]|uniref:complex I subunit 1 family protein n=1 Tax=Lapillicoccus sp. TaxID=1909287 RepID=UPI00398369FF